MPVALSATSRPGTTPFTERSIVEPTNLAAVPLICCEWYQRPELAGHLTWTDYALRSTGLGARWGSVSKLQPSARGGLTPCVGHHHCGLDARVAGQNGPSPSPWVDLHHVRIVFDDLMG